jgi:protein involved in polysaccharide export with SLBB domain
MTVRISPLALLSCGAIALVILFFTSARADDAKESAFRIRAGDRLYLHVDPTFPGDPVKGVYRVEPSGKLPLGPAYGRVQVNGLTPEEAEEKVREHLAKILKNPHVSITWYDPVAHGSGDLADRISRLEKELQELQAALSKQGAPTGPR